MRVEKKRRIRGVHMGFFNKHGLCTEPSAALRSLPTQPAPSSHLPLFSQPGMEASVGALHLPPQPPTYTSKFQDLSLSFLYPPAHLLPGLWYIIFPTSSPSHPITHIPIPKSLPWLSCLPHFLSQAASGLGSLYSSHHNPLLSSLD